MKKILLGVDDVPTVSELEDASSRLKKCHEILSRTRGVKDKEDPKSLIAVATFIDMLLNREAKAIRKTNA